MDNPLRAWARQYLKTPDAWRGLAITGGLLMVDLFIIDKRVTNFIFGKDGKGGEVIACYSRIDPHTAEYKEGRKKWYWH
jgi:hypothetical protein